MSEGEKLDLSGLSEPKIASPIVPVVEGEPQPPVDVDLNELMEARQDPEVLELMQGAAREGAQIKAEGRQRW